MDDEQPWSKLVGTRLAGRVRAYRGLSVVTDFVHVLGFPFMPLRSFVEIEPEASACLPIPTDVRSITAALTPWIALVASVAGALDHFPAWSVAVAISASFSAVALRFVGRREKKLRDAFALTLDHGFDPAWRNPADRQSLQEDLLREIQHVIDHTQAEQLTFRNAAHNELTWVQAVESSDTRDRSLLSKALLLARIEEVNATTRNDKRAWRAVQDRMLARFDALPPLSLSEGESQEQERDERSNDERARSALFALDDGLHRAL